MRAYPTETALLLAESEGESPLEPAERPEEVVVTASLVLSCLRGNAVATPGWETERLGTFAPPLAGRHEDV